MRGSCHHQRHAPRFSLHRLSEFTVDLRGDAFEPVSRIDTPGNIQNCLRPEHNLFVSLIARELDAPANKRVTYPASAGKWFQSR